MAAASRGARPAGGTVVGLLPGADRDAANEWVTVALPTGLGELRNGLIVRAADVVVAVGGAYGTLSEIALALAADVPVVGARHLGDRRGRAGRHAQQAVQRGARAGHPRMTLDASARA